MVARVRGGAADEDNAALFRRDVAALQAQRSQEISQLEYISTCGSTYTVLWDAESWDGHISVSRYLRHMRTWHKSTTAKVIVPVVASITVWAAIVCGINTHTTQFKLKMPLAPLSLVSSALALLLTLRTNQSLTRLLEARLAWGKAVLHARIIAGILATQVFPVKPGAAFLCGRLLCVVGW